MTDHSLEFLIRAANHQGLLVNNLFQLSNGRWQANLYQRGGEAKGPICWKWGIGASPNEALESAMGVVIRDERAKPLPLDSGATHTLDEMGF